MNQSKPTKQAPVWKMFLNANELCWYKVENNHLKPKISYEVKKMPPRLMHTGCARRILLLWLPPNSTNIGHLVNFYTKRDAMFWLHALRLWKVIFVEFNIIEPMVMTLNALKYKGMDALKYSVALFSLHFLLQYFQVSDKKNFIYPGPNLAALHNHDHVLQTHLHEPVQQQTAKGNWKLFSE